MTLPPVVSMASGLIAFGLFVALAALLWVDQRMHQRARIRLLRMQILRCSRDCEQW